MYFKTLTPRRLLPLTLRNSLFFLLFFGVTSLFGQERKIENELTVDERRSLQEEARLVISILQSNHLSKRGFHELSAEELLYFYLGYLDPEGMIFNDRQATFLVKRFERSLKASYLSKGDMYPAYEMFNTFNKNAGKRIEWIQERLDEPFDLEGDGTYEINFEDEENPWPKNKRVADDKWERYLTYQLLNEMLIEDDLEKAVRAIRDRYDNFAELVDEYDPMAIRELFLGLVMSLYDPHSGYSSWESTQEMMIGMEGSLVGIGADLVTVDGECIVERVIPGGPADLNGGFYEGDRVVSIQQGEEKAVEVFGLRLRDIIQMLRGEVGTELTLVLKSPRSEYRRTILLIRDEIDMAASRCKAYLYEVPGANGVRKVGVINIPQFYGDNLGENSEFSVTDDVKVLVNQLEVSGMEALVMDVRQNPGGLLPEAVSLVGLFIETGAVVMIQDGVGQVEVIRDDDPEIYYKGPVVILISERSASASEILAGSLSDYKRAIIVGNKSTFGKGTMQQAIDLGARQEVVDSDPNVRWGGLRTTTALFFTTGGASTQNRGVLSDIVFPFAVNPEFQMEKDMPHALEWMEVESEVPQDLAVFHPEGTYVLDDVSLTTIQSLFDERMETLPEFILWNEIQEFFSEWYQKTEFTLNLGKRKAERSERMERSRLLKARGQKLAVEVAYPYSILQLDNEASIEAERQRSWKEDPLPNGLSRANRFYKNIYYWQSEKDGAIADVSVRDVAFGEFLPMVGEIVEQLKPYDVLAVSKDQLTILFDELRDNAYSGDLDCLEILKEALGENISDDQSDDFYSALFACIISIDTDLVNDYSLMDIILREGMRNAVDWLELEEAN